MFRQQQHYMQHVSSLLPNRTTNRRLVDVDLFFRYFDSFQFRMVEETLVVHHFHIMLMVRLTTARGLENPTTSYLNPA